MWSASLDQKANFSRPRKILAMRKEVASPEMIVMSYEHLVLQNPGAYGLESCKSYGA